MLEILKTFVKCYMKTANKHFSYGGGGGGQKVKNSEFGEREELNSVKGTSHNDPQR